MEDSTGLALLTTVYVTKTFIKGYSAVEMPKFSFIFSKQTNSQLMWLEFDMLSRSS